MDQVTVPRATVQQALEALGKWSTGRDMDAVELNDLIATLEAALKQPGQAEPVAWIDNTGHPKHRLYLQSATERRLYGPLRPLYAVPRPITTTTKPEPQPEPFGYFRAEPFGWTDCAETDEGAKALYQKPPTAWTPATTPPDTERTVLVWAGDEWLSAWYHSESGHWMDACMGAGLVNVTHWMEPTPPTTTTQPEPK